MMHDLIVKRIIRFVVLTAAICLMLSVPVLADTGISRDSPYDDSVKEFPSIEITGTHSFAKGSYKSGTLTFILTAKSKDDPMPEGSVNGVKKVTISPGGEFKFGKIVFPKQGNYHYTVSRELNKTKGLKQDNTRYEAEVQVFANGETVLVFREVGKTGKPNKIEYKDEYTEQDTDKDRNKKAPQTGDEVSLILICMITMFVSLRVLGGAHERNNIKKNNL